MNPDVEMPEIDRNVGNSALRVYGDAMDDFPVLKAFQQYIDAEQAKARKRLLSLGIFFGILTGAIIAVFVVMLMHVTARNQQLNDRLVEYAMKERDKQGPVVVQPAQDTSAITALATKLDELQRRLDENKAKAEREAAVAAERARIAAEAAKPREPTPEELEIKRLNALLAAEREKVAENARLEKERADAERKRKREEELEAYRRKYYPELYGLPKTLPKAHRASTAVATPLPTPKLSSPIADDDEDLPDDDSAIDYFADEEVKPVRQNPGNPIVQPTSMQPNTATQPIKRDEPYQIPVEVKGKNSSFRIPID